MKVKQAMALLHDADPEAELDRCSVGNFNLRASITGIHLIDGVPIIELEATSDDTETDFDSLLGKIHQGYYDRENGTAQFKADVLFHYGEDHTPLFSEIFQQHADLQGRARLEETLGDFVKAI